MTLSTLAILVFIASVPICAMIAAYPVMDERRNILRLIRRIRHIAKLNQEWKQ